MEHLKKNYFSPCNTKYFYSQISCITQLHSKCNLYQIAQTSILQIDPLQNGSRDVFTNLTHIYDETFCKNSDFYGLKYVFGYNHLKYWNKNEKKVYSSKSLNDLDFLKFLERHL